MRFQHVGAKQLLFLFLAFLAVITAEFVILEGTIGISLPSGRYSASSSLEIRNKGSELHFVTHNSRFTVVDFLSAHGSRPEPLVLRESFVTDQEDSAEGPPPATVTVEAMNGQKVRWSFHELGERGDAVTNSLYRVVRGSNGETPNTYTYFSLADGRKVRTSQYVELSKDQLEALDSLVTR